MANVLISHSRGFGFCSRWDGELLQWCLQGIPFSFPESPWLLGGAGLWLCRAVLRARGGVAKRTTVLGNPEGASFLGPPRLCPSL